MIEIEFHGASKTVTGSNYLVKTPRGNFIVDCGMYQGIDVEGSTLEPYAYKAKDVDFVMLTHAHIDHSGMIPKLFKEGYRGPVYATGHTIQITGLLLQDSAKIQENNYKEGRPFGKYTNKVAMVYNAYDAEQAIENFKSVRFDETFEPVQGIKVKFIRAGHILGAVSIEITVDDDGVEKVLMFSGDIGREKQALIESFDPNYRATPDVVIMEALYGTEYHPPRQDSAADMVAKINETIQRGGNVYVPVFAVQRVQEVLHDLKAAIEAGQMDARIPVWLDSPLAQKVSNIYMSALQNTEESLFQFDSLKYVKFYRQSKKLTKQKGQVILAGSGMADGGRILSHLVTGLNNPRNSVIFVGYQAEGTIGRQLVDGHKEVTIDGTKVHVKAEILHLHGFSAHGDKGDYERWVDRFKSEKLKKVFLVHAEEETSEEFEKDLNQRGYNDVVIPDWKETYTI